jgi:hypothetical protein
MVEIVHVDMVFEGLSALLKEAEVAFLDEGPDYLYLPHSSHVARGDLAHIAVTSALTHGLHAMLLVPPLWHIRRLLFVLVLLIAADFDSILCNGHSLDLILVDSGGLLY